MEQKIITLRLTPEAAARIIANAEKRKMRRSDYYAECVIEGNKALAKQKGKK